MQLHVCERCQRAFPRVGAKPWCPHCGSRLVENTQSDPELDYADLPDEREEPEAETGGWFRIIVTLLLILAFYVLFAGDDSLDLIRSWYNSQSP